MRFIATTAAVLALCLSGCSAGSGARRDAIDRVLAEAPRKAQPTEVVAADLALARAAREDGQWTALRASAAPGAVLDLSGEQVVASNLRNRPAPAAASQWTPEAVWMSCDSQLAVSQGKYVEPDGTWGYYATAWERQRDGSYRWTFMLRAPDADLTARQRRAGDTVEDDGTIIVQAIPMIRGETGDCLSGTPPPLTDISSPAGAENKSASPDGTLVWRWARSPDGSRKFFVFQAEQGRLDETFTMEVTGDGRVTITK